MNINRDAIEALLKMGRGDMRRVLNVLQSAAVAYPQEITFESLFLVTGNPVPKHIDAVFQSLLNDSFNDAPHHTTRHVHAGRVMLCLMSLTLLNERVLDTQLPRRMKAHLRCEAGRPRAEAAPRDAGAPPSAPVSARPRACARAGRRLSSLSRMQFIYPACIYVIHHGVLGYFTRRAPFAMIAGLTIRNLPFNPHCYASRAVQCVASSESLQDT